MLIYLNYGVEFEKYVFVLKTGFQPCKLENDNLKKWTSSSYSSNIFQDIINSIHSNYSHAIKIILGNLLKL